MADFSLAEFQKLYDRRELAALNCVNAIQFVLTVFEAETFERAREILQDALDQHKQADDLITAFHSKLKKENQSDVRKSSAA